MTNAEDYSNPATRTDAGLIYFEDGYSLAVDRAQLAAQADAWRVGRRGADLQPLTAHPSRVAYRPTDDCKRRNPELIEAMAALTAAGVEFID